MTVQLKKPADACDVLHMDGHLGSYGSFDTPVT